MPADRNSSAFVLAAIGLAVAWTSTGAAPPSPTRWPLAAGPPEATFTIYPPQVDRLADDRFEGRAAVSLKRRGEMEPTIGVVWLRSRTSLERLAGQVTLDDVDVVKASFPWERDGGRAILDSFRSLAIGTVTVPLAAFNASPSVPAPERRSQGPQPPQVPAPPPPRPVAPRVIRAPEPAILVLVDGDYDIRPVPGAKVLRVMNTHSLLLQDAATSRFYLPMGSAWLVAAAPNARWTVANKVPPGLEAARKEAAAEPGVETYARPGEAIAALLRAGRAPTVIVSTTPAVLASRGTKEVGLPKEAHASPARPRPGRFGDLFVGPDDNVYRPASSGWEKTNGRDWYPLQAARKSGPPSALSVALVSRLEAERRAREAR